MKSLFIALAVVLFVSCSSDDNGDNWLPHTGGFNPGEGLMVFPQPDGTSSGSYVQQHTLGTLNSGVVEFNLNYNNGPSDSPNMMANPYASAIDAELFFDHAGNADINEVYFWEHMTPLWYTQFVEQRWRDAAM